MRRQSRSARNIAWIESFCRVPEGKDVGKPVRLREWQREIVRGIYDTPTRQAIISFGRKNAKTALAAMLDLLHLVGPEYRQNSQLVSTALSRDQAAKLFALAAKMVRMSPDLNAHVVVRDSLKELYCKELGTVYSALSADADKNYGSSPVFAVHDELGQVKGPRSELYESIETGMGAHEEPLSVVISTQAPTDEDLLSILIDDARSERDPKRKLFMYSAPDELDPFGDEAIRAANPAFGDFLNATEIRDAAEAARRMPSRESSYRNLHLNQRVEAVSPFVPRSVWEANGAQPAAANGRKVWGGLDLSAVADLTAFVAVDDSGGVHPTFWLPKAGLLEKSRSEKVPYDLWERQGFLKTTPGNAIDFEFVAEFLRGFFDSHDVQAVGFDRALMNFLTPWLVKVGFSEVELAKFKPFGQGTLSMTPALRELEVRLLNKALKHGNHPVLAMCNHNVRVVGESGARKFDKRKSRGRIDGMTALANAIGVMPAMAEQKSYQFFVV